MMINILIALCFCALPFSLMGTELSLRKEAMESETPQYLYKILSMRNWQATQARKTVMLSADDDAFIHFSREDQLERILSKYWADAPEAVILKIETAKLEGDLVFEANPGGTSKYYHLYRGFIPIGSIVEAKVIFREPMKGSQALDNVKAGDPILRKAARELSVE